ncbi:uncharacterized protein [Amphiura filiformis]|uniref:uncharacterized protein n=1 Tax=Amphiura filiformis TaxID=82378 RepID=UPI003B222CEF
MTVILLRSILKTQARFQQHFQRERRKLLLLLGIQLARQQVVHSQQLLRMLGVVRALLDRGESLVTEEADRQKEETNIREALSGGGYPEWSIKKVKQNRATPKTKTTSKNKDDSEKSKGDIVPPLITCGQDVSSQVQCGQANRNVCFNQCTATDNLGTPSVRYSSGFTQFTPQGNQQCAIYPIGVTTVTATATDNCGLSMFDTITVTVTGDTVRPFISCGQDVSSQVQRGQASTQVCFNQCTATDNLGTPTVRYSSGSIQFTPQGNQQCATYPTGVTTVTATATDNCGISMSDTITVTVTAGCTGVNISVTVAHLRIPCFTLQLLVVLFILGLTRTASATTTDAAGDQALCQFTVQVLAVGIICPTVNSSSSSQVSFDSPTLSNFENPDIVTITYSYGGQSQQIAVSQQTHSFDDKFNFATGRNIIFVSASDGANTAACSFTYTKITTVARIIATTDTTISIQISNSDDDYIEYQVLYHSGTSARKIDIVDAQQEIIVLEDLTPGTSYNIEITGLTVDNQLHVLASLKESTDEAPGAKNANIGLIVGVAIGVLIVIIVFPVACVFVYRQRQKGKPQNRPSNNGERGGPDGNDNEGYTLPEAARDRSDGYSIPLQNTSYTDLKPPKPHEYESSIPSNQPVQQETPIQYDSPYMEVK